MLKTIFILLIFSTSYLLSIEIDTQTPYNELLSHSQIYIDNNKSEAIKSIQKRKFEKNSRKQLGYGYSPNYAVWIRFTLTNTTDKTVEKIVEYANPLTSYVNFYEEDKLKKEDGILNVSKGRSSLNPTFKVTLKPHESKEFFIKASSKITTLIIKLNLWNTKTFEDKERLYSLTILVFFAVIVFVILYNIVNIIITKELSYLYFILFFISVIFHHFMYKGIATLYFSSEVMESLINCSSCIVAMPIIFLALFTQRILKLKQYPKLNKYFKYILMLYPIVMVVIFLTEEYQYRSLFSALLLICLFIIATFALFKKNENAYFVFFILILIVTSGLLMYLSSLGIYDIFRKYPYYIEIVWSSVIIIFPLRVLFTKMKALKEEKVQREKSDLLLQEHKHRIANQNQNILNFVSMQQNNVDNEDLQTLLKSLEHRIMVTIEVFSQLEKKNSRQTVSTYKYFSLITEKLKESFGVNHVTISIESDIFMNTQDTITCCYIVNEAVCNAFKYAFIGLTSGEIEISLDETKEEYTLKIKDNGNGFKETRENGTGLKLINKLATLQLDGSLEIKQNNGVQLEITWSKDER